MHTLLIKLIDGVRISAPDGYLYVYKWSSGESTRDIFVLIPGIYYVNITDRYGCKATSNLVTVYYTSGTPTTGSEISVSLTSGSTTSFLSTGELLHSSTKEEESNGVRWRAIVGGVIGGVLVIVASILLFVFLKR